MSLEQAGMGHENHGQDVGEPEMVGDDKDWMVGVLESLDEEQINALMAGSVPVAGLEPVADVVARLRRSAAAEPVPPMSPELRALLEGPRPVPLHPRWTTRRVTVRAAAVAAAAAGLALFSTGAAQNRLPAEIQDVVSYTAQLVGIDVPSSEERGALDPPAAPSDEGQGTTVTQPGPPPESSPAGAGADRADPGSPGDHEPATPATGSRGSEAREGAGPDATPPPSGAAGGPSDRGLENGRGTAGSSGEGSVNSSASGQENGTGTAKKP